MNVTVKRMLGEHEDMSEPEERKEVQLAKQILAAEQSGDSETVIQAASELIRMHHPPTAASYAKQLSLSMMALPSSQSYPSSP